MSRNDDLRKMLRASDPARDREMSPVERARIKAALATMTSRPSRSWAPLLALGAVMAAILVAASLWISRSPEPAEQAQSPVPAPTPPPVAQVEPSRPVPVAVSRPPRVRRAQARPAVLDVTPRTTRIDFTAPEGTRILWFVGSPDAKELGS